MPLLRDLTTAETQPKQFQAFCAVVFCRRLLPLQRSFPRNNPGITCMLSPVTKNNRELFEMRQNDPMRLQFATTEDPIVCSLQYVPK
jgi:hypothetical protein